MILDLFLFLILNSFVIQGLYRSAMFEWQEIILEIPQGREMQTKYIDKKYNMILWWIRFYSLKYIGLKWSKPIITCPTCMASLHSIYFYWLLVYPYAFNSNLIQSICVYPLYILALAGLNSYITSKTN